MNGGHYLTKGHVILCLLYIKTSLMSRNILEPGKNRFSDANSPWLKGRSAPSTPAILTDPRRSRKKSHSPSLRAKRSNLVCYNLPISRDCFVTAFLAMTKSTTFCDIVIISGRETPPVSESGSGSGSDVFFLTQERVWSLADFVPLPFRAHGLPLRSGGAGA